MSSPGGAVQARGVLAEHHDWKPSVNPWMVAASVMISTFMVVLDSSVANVALPHIAGNLSASTDESTWVLTSYLVSNAIMLPASGWIARRIGRKRLLMLSITIFTLASLLCGMAINMPMLIVARVLQGAGGGGMQPLAQSILLESFPPHKHGTAMAVYGMGVVVAPVIGPTLGGWITDSFSWRWIFYINLPIGLLALFMMNLNIEDPPYLRNAVKGAIDYMGFGLLAVWLGALQLVLDKGQEADWFDARWICWTTALTVAALVAFVGRELKSKEPIVQLRALRERNFGLGYSALYSGLAVSPRGVGSIVSMLLVGVLVNKVDGRLLLAMGFAIMAFSTFQLARVNLDISIMSVVVPNFFNGFAGGFIFVPLTTMTMARLKKHEIGNASGIYNLLRNIGGSIGIAMVTTMLVRGAQRHQNYLAANISASDLHAQELAMGLAAKFHAGGASMASAHTLALGALYRSTLQQASLMAYTDNFQLLAYLSLICIPPVVFLRKLKRKPLAGTGTAEK